MSPYCSFINIINELGLTETLARNDHDYEGSIDMSMHLCCGLKGICSISVWDLKTNEIWNPRYDQFALQNVSAVDPLEVSRQLLKVCFWQYIYTLAIKKIYGFT